MAHLNRSAEDMKLLLVLLSLVLLAGCTSPSHSAIATAPAVPSAEERLATATKTNESLLSVIRTLKPEAFAEVGLYRINPGDTAAKIARKHSLRIDDLMILNPGVDWTRLKVWQVIRVKSAEEEPIQPPQTTTGSSAPSRV